LASAGRLGLRRQLVPLGRTYLRRGRPRGPRADPR